MAWTPWGDTHSLDERSLRPGTGTSRQAGARDRRERLFAAMVANVAERGYERTTVADLTQTAHVSRSAFYEQFRSKQDCVLATIDELVGLASQAALQEFDRPGSWEERLLAVLETVIGLVVAFPEAARLCYSDAYAAGPEAAARVEAIVDVFLDLGHKALSESPTRAGLPPDVVRAIVGGIREVISEHLANGRERELPDKTTALAAWALSYSAPEQGLRRLRRSSRPAGTPRRIEADPEDRIVYAMAEMMAGPGFVETTVADVVTAASTSLRTFYAHFDGKESAYLAALTHCRAQILAAVQPAIALAPDWQHAVRDGFRALFSFLAVERSWAGVMAESRAAGNRATRYHQETMRMFGDLITPGRADSGPLTDVGRTAVSGAIYSLAVDQIRRGRAARLPELVPFATFVALAPYLGSDLAATIADADAAARQVASR